LVSRLQTMDSSDRFWKLISNRSPSELKGSPEKVAALRDLFFFEANPSISRVITIGTPHYGSDFANDATRWISRKFITLPAMLTQTGDELIQANPDFFHDTDLLTISTSVDSLSSACPFLPVMLEAPSSPWVRYHNVIGVVPDESMLGQVGLSWKEEGDGIVPLKSARVSGVQSELIVPAEHMDVHRHPLTILEVRRILIEHLSESSTLPHSHVATVSGSMTDHSAVPLSPPGIPSSPHLPMSPEVARRPFVLPPMAPLPSSFDATHRSLVDSPRTR